MVHSVLLTIVALLLSSVILDDATQPLTYARLTKTVSRMKSVKIVFVKKTDAIVKQVNNVKMVFATWRQFAIKIMTVLMACIVIYLSTNANQ